MTTFLLNPRMDEGAVIDRRTVAILPEDNVGSLHDKLMTVGAGLVLESVARVVDETFHPQPQPELPASELKPAPKIFKETCRIDFGVEGERIIRLIRGLAPYPGAWTRLEERSGRRCDPVAHDRREDLCGPFRGDCRDSGPHRRGDGCRRRVAHCLP